MSAVLKTECKHEKLTAVLRQEISKKKFPDGRFHTVKFIMDKYKVSQATLTKALEPLFNEGILYSVNGKGTFIHAANSASGPVSSVPALTYCIVSHREMFDRSYNPGSWFAAQEILAGISAESESRGSRMNLVTLKPDDIAAFRLFAKQENAAFLFQEFPLYEGFIEHCVKNRLPYTVYAHHARISRNLNQIWLDVADAERAATEYIAGLGHRHIAFLGDLEGSERYNGYRAGLKNAGIPFRKEFCFYDLNAVSLSTRRTARLLLETRPEITAVVCSNDLRAIDMLHIALECGKKSPDFAIIGMDDSQSFYHPPLPITTIRLPFREIGAQLVSRSEASLTPDCVRLSGTLVKGETT